MQPGCRTSANSVLITPAVATSTTRVVPVCRQVESATHRDGARPPAQTMSGSRRLPSTEVANSHKYAGLSETSLCPPGADDRASPAGCGRVPMSRAGRDQSPTACAQRRRDRATGQNVTKVCPISGLARGPLDRATRLPVRPMGTSTDRTAPSGDCGGGMVRGWGLKVGFWVSGFGEAGTP